MIKIKINKELILKILPFIILIMIGSVIFIYYSAEHQYPPCCDTAVTMMKAKQIANTGSLNPTQLFNPSAEAPLYKSIVSTEAPLHLVLAIFYKISPALSESLEFAKYFFLFFFVLPIFPIYILGKKLLKNNYLPLILIIILYFTFWFGELYWLGFVAQTFALTFLTIFIIFLHEYSEKNKLKYLIISLIFWLIIFFAHVLTFLLTTLILFTYLLVHAHKYFGKKKWYLYLGYLLLPFILVIYSKYMTSHQALDFQFPVRDVGTSIASLINNIFNISGLALIFILFIYGGAILIQKKKYIYIIWMLSVVLLTQSDKLGTPFYADRFNQFIALPYIIITFVGIKYLVDLIKSKKIIYLVIILFIIILLPIGFTQQEKLKKCYVRNCVDLHPTQMPVEDQEAFNWINKNITHDKIFTGIRKFGNYLPIVTNNPIEFPIGEKRAFFYDTTSQERWELAKKYNVNYVFWDAIFDIQNNKVKTVIGFTEEEFKDEKYFKKVYDQNKVRIYEVLP